VAGYCKHANELLRFINLYPANVENMVSA